MKKFIPPTIEQATKYARSIGYWTFDYNVWYAYYETRNWCPSGSNKQMSSWKAAIRTFFYRTDEYRELKRKQADNKAYEKQQREQYEDYLAGASDIKLKEMRKAKEWQHIWWLIDEKRPKPKPLPDNVPVPQMKGVGRGINVGNERNKQKDELGVK